MKIKNTFIGILLVCGALAFNACDDDKDETSKLLPLLMLGGEGKAYTIGDIGPSGVGIVFYITDGGLHGLEAAPVDQSTGTEWSTIQDALVNRSTPLPTGIGTGSANTDAIIAQNRPLGSAAKLCRDYRGGGKKSWFLPSLEELDQLYAQRAIVGGFENNDFWSSSEDDANQAYAKLFIDGAQENYEKHTNCHVRAIRAF